jgi:hypothetical protein
MSYLLLEDFAAGIDLRKSIVTAKAGGLRELTNGFVNAGGEIERRRKFDDLAVVPADTYGLAGLDNELWVFGLAAPGSVSVSAPVNYQQLVPNPALSGGETIDRILDVEVFQSQFYVIVRLSDGTVRHFLNGAQVPSTPTGGACKPHRNKMYTVQGTVVKFSAVGDGDDYTTGTGFGSIDTTAYDSNPSEIIGIEPYYTSLALLGRRSVQIWTMASDPAQNQFVQALPDVGLIAPRGAARYGNGDILFLSDTGIRSVRARDSSNAAILNDIGSPIDSLIQARRLSMTQLNAERIVALSDPASGHFWLVWEDRIYVLSYYPATKVTAWSIYEPGFTMDYVAQVGQHLCIRSGNTIYLYGDASSPTTALDSYTPSATLGAEYDNCTVALSTPMLDFGKPATQKVFSGIDVACEGVWTIDVCPDPLAPQSWVTVAVVSEPTFSLRTIPYDATTTHIAVRARATGSGFARLGSIALHYSDGDED